MKQNYIQNHSNTHLNTKHLLTNIKQNKTKFILLILLILLFQTVSNAQNYSIKQLTPTNGISEDRTDIALDINELGSVAMYSQVNSAVFTNATEQKRQLNGVSPNNYLPIPLNKNGKTNSNFVNSANMASVTTFYLVKNPDQPGQLFQPVPGKDYRIHALDNGDTGIGFTYRQIILDEEDYLAFLASYWDQPSTPVSFELPDRYIASEARGVSFDRRFITGEMFNRDDQTWHAFLVNKSIPSLIELSSPNTFGADVNVNREVVGQKDGKAYAWNSSFTGSFLNAPNSILSEATKINDSGQIIVKGTFNGNEGSFLYKNGTLTTFSDTLKIISARGLNNNGQVVGAAQNSDGSIFAFVWDSINGLKNLNEAIPNNSGWFLLEGIGINNSGQITGYGVINNKIRSFILDLEVAEPLIFVPGVSGSQLNTASGTRVWVGTLGATNSFRQLTLDPNKTQQDIVAVDALRKVIAFGREFQDVYDPILNMLATEGRYVEYQVDNNPTRRTTAGCDLTQQANKPTLFVFGYDWRKSNAENAQLLKDYVGCVKRFYPNKRIDILAHSMGGLLSRRYIIDNADSHQVNKLITIASPFLGAPKGIYVMETGEFFSNFLDIFFQNSFRNLTEFFPGAHELLPSQSYFNLAGSYFGEAPREVSGSSVGTWDINGNGFLDDTYSHNQFKSLFDSTRFPRSTPSQTNLLFHNNEGQDDWQQDQTGIKYFHIYGIQHQPSTVGKVFAGRAKAFDSNGRTIVKNAIFTTPTFGDGTVPEISASRIGNNQNLNLANATLIPFRSTLRSTNIKVEHNGLTMNTDVHNEILSILRTPNSPQSFYQTKNENNLEIQSQLDPCRGGESYFINFFGTQNLIVSNETGQNTGLIDGLPFYKRLPTIDILRGLNSISIQMPTAVELTDGKHFEITFQSIDEPMLIGISRSCDNTIKTQTQVIRYLDLNYAEGINFKLRLTSTGFENLKYDQEGDGEFESTIAPTAFAEGELAKDGSAPTVSFASELQGDQQKVTITAEDNAGVKIIRYSLNGTRYQTYSTPLLINPTETPKIWVIADDNVGNRSETNTYDVPPAIPPTLAVIPILECIEENNDGTYIAKFGYDNKNLTSVTIPVGKNNKFTPAPHDKGQTTSFQSGRNNFVFNVSFSNGNLKWHLRGPDGSKRKVTASRKSPRCE